MSTTTPTRVVVLGGGFAGATAARELESSKNVAVTLISERPFMYIKFGGLRAAALGGAWIDRTMVPLDKVVGKRGGRVVVGRVARVDAAGNAVELADGSRVPYDVLVCATGSRSKSMAEPPAGASTTADEHRAWLESSRAAVASFDRIVVAGGGPVAIEFAGEVRARYPNKVITIVTGKSGVLGAGVPPLPESMRTAMAKLITEQNVRIVNGNVSGPALDVTRPFTVVPNGKVTISDGTTVDADVLFYGVGVQLHDTSIYPAAWLDASTKEIVVGRDYRVAGTTNVFAIGDVAKTGRVKLGYLATADGKAVAANVRAVAAGKPTKPVFTPPPETAKTFMVVPFGPKLGRGYFGVSLGNWATSMIKGKDLFETKAYKDLTGEKPVAAPKA